MNSKTQNVTSIIVAIVKSTNQTSPNIKNTIPIILNNFTPPKEMVLYIKIKKQSQKNIMNLNDNNKMEWTFDHIFISYNAHSFCDCDTNYL